MLPMPGSDSANLQPLDYQSPVAHARYAAKVRFAAAALAFCCLLWGLSFPVMQFASTAFQTAVRPDRSSPPLRLTLAMQATFNGWRFALAAVLYYLLTRSRQRNYRPVDWHAGAAVGLFCGCGMFLQLTGLRYTLPSISGFLTALVVVFAPLAQSLIFRKPVTLRIWLAVVVAVAGILILAQANPDAHAQNTLALTPPLPYLGEILTVLSSMLFTAQIMAVDRFGSAADTARMTAVMLAVVALVNTTLALALGGAQIYRATILFALLRDPVFIASILSLIVFCTVTAMHLMNTYQPAVSAAVASVIYCLEPVFATLWSTAFRTESLTRITIAGGVVILLAVLIVAQTPSRKSLAPQ